MRGAADDRRFMAAAIRLSERHAGLTGTNPSVGALIVSPGGAILGRAVTALGGRPHAETQALAEAGEAARGATAYVTLEPCAHHGRTPPCADALVRAGVARVVVGTCDPDPRVAGGGIAILRAAGIAVEENVLREEAERALAPYLTRARNKRAHVTLKLALSADDMIGRRGEGQLPITSTVARAQVQMLRAASDAILVGIGTVEADDPLLSVRLPGLADRSPTRIVLDRQARLSPGSALVRSAASVPLLLVSDPNAPGRAQLAEKGVRFLPAMAIAALLEALAGEGMSSLIVEGGAITARQFLEAGLVDRILLFQGPSTVGGGGIASPLGWNDAPPGFRLVSEGRLGQDRFKEWETG